MARAITFRRIYRNITTFPYIVFAIIQCKHTKKKRSLLIIGVCICMIISIALYMRSDNYTVDNEEVTGYSMAVTNFNTTVPSKLQHNESQSSGNHIHIHTPSRLTDKRVLVLFGGGNIRYEREIIVQLQSNRFRYANESIFKPLPQLTHKGRGRYAVIIFQRFESYLKMDYAKRDVLDTYCRKYNVGIMAFTHPSKRLTHAQAVGFPLYIQTQLRLQNFELDRSSDILNITKAGSPIRQIPGSDWTVFMSNHSTYRRIAWAHLAHDSKDEESASINPPLTTAILDTGLYDGVQRVLFGNSLSFWPHKLLFIDAIMHLSRGALSVSLDRYIQIDIDDIFVGKRGIRMKEPDVQALLQSQSKLQQSVPGFHFNLGFSGKHFHSGSEDENAGDDSLIEHAQSFWWFGHTWSHAQAHKLNFTALKQEMLKNKQFAKDRGIPVNSSYAVAPHHSGVFPVHEQLYEVWKQVWGVRVTSTEEYPGLRPAWKRRGFVHRGIKVLPRQTCGLFTHTIHLTDYPGGAEALQDSIGGGELFLSFLHTPVLPRQTCGLYTKNVLWNDYPGGAHKLIRSIYGGDLFTTFVYSPVMIFMTHLSNYGNDRLALYTFESVIEFVQKHTNLRLHSVRPNELASIYFDMYPQEKEPVWLNPCNDKRHMDIWSAYKSCDRLPDALVIGPQKTGTSALYSFLSMHPSVLHNYNSPTTFEEVQFFNGKNYLEGLDWYMEFFPGKPKHQHDRSSTLLFEKSANYFDASLAASRVRALLPDALLISILIDPGARAYSWYQHQRSHDIPAALEYSFHDVVTASDSAPRIVRELRHRCLEPGLYAFHLDKWFKKFPSEQILVIDGDELRSNPVAVMRTVQLFLELEPTIDYSSKIRYNADKGFYCEVLDEDHSKCLGIGKGRDYPPMETRTVSFLQDYYSRPNAILSELLKDRGQPLPGWLRKSVANGS